MESSTQKEQENPGLSSKHRSKKVGIRKRERCTFHSNDHLIKKTVPEMYAN